jgi:hypothetical protein
MNQTMTKENVMSVPLPEPLQQALDGRPGEPLRLVDPRTRAAYVLIPADLYERLQALLGEEDLTPEEKLFLLAESGRRAGWDAPEMDDYDNYDESRKKLCP